MLYQRARQLPLRHLSIRVPWNDTGWQGCVCRRPEENLSCMILKNIHEKRDDNEEERLAGKSWKDLSPDQWPPCLVERGGFMAVLGPASDQRAEWRETLDSLRGQAQAAGDAPMQALLEAILALLDADGNPAGLGEGLEGVHAQTCAHRGGIGLGDTVGGTPRRLRVHIL